MIKEIVFKNIDGTQILKFDSFEFTDPTIWPFIYFRLYIDFDLFHVTTVVKSEPFDFSNMSKCLEKLYERKWKSFIFNPIEELFWMQFELQENGNIKVNGWLKASLSNPIFIGKMEFNFMINRTCIVEIIKAIKNVM
jgi:hypothetical protein